MKLTESYSKSLPYVVTLRDLFVWSQNLAFIQTKQEGFLRWNKALEPIIKNPMIKQAIADEFEGLDISDTSWNLNVHYFFKGDEIKYRFVFWRGAFTEEEADQSDTISRELSPETTQLLIRHGYFDEVMLRRGQYIWPERDLRSIFQDANRHDLEIEGESFHDISGHVNNLFYSQQAYFEALLRERKRGFSNIDIASMSDYSQLLSSVLTGGGYFSHGLQSLWVTNSAGFDVQKHENLFVKGVSRASIYRNQGELYYSITTSSMKISYFNDEDYIDYVTLPGSARALFRFSSEGPVLIGVEVSNRLLRDLLFNKIDLTFDLLEEARQEEESLLEEFEPERFDEADIQQEEVFQEDLSQKDAQYVQRLEENFNDLISYKQASWDSLISVLPLEFYPYINKINLCLEAYFQLPDDQKIQEEGLSLLRVALRWIGECRLNVDAAPIEARDKLLPKLEKILIRRFVLLQKELNINVDLSDLESVTRALPVDSYPEVLSSTPDLKKNIWGALKKSGRRWPESVSAVQRYADFIENAENIFSSVETTLGNYLNSVHGISPGIAFEDLPVSKKAHNKVYSSYLALKMIKAFRDEHGLLGDQKNLAAIDDYQAMIDVLTQIKVRNNQQRKFWQGNRLGRCLTQALSGLRVKPKNKVYFSRTLACRLSDIESDLFKQHQAPRWSFFRQANPQSVLKTTILSDPIKQLDDFVSKAVAELSSVNDQSTLQSVHAKYCDALDEGGVSHLFGEGMDRFDTDLKTELIRFFSLVSGFKSLAYSALHDIENTDTRADLSMVIDDYLSSLEAKYLEIKDDTTPKLKYSLKGVILDSLKRDIYRTIQEAYYEKEQSFMRRKDEYKNDIFLELSPRLDALYNANDLSDVNHLALITMDWLNQKLDALQSMNIEDKTTLRLEFNQIIKGVSERRMDTLVRHRLSDLIAEAEVEAKTLESEDALTQLLIDALLSIEKNLFEYRKNYSMSENFIKDILGGHAWRLMSIINEEKRCLIEKRESNQFDLNVVDINVDDEIESVFSIIIKNMRDEAGALNSEDELTDLKIRYKEIMFSFLQGHEITLENADLIEHKEQELESIIDDFKSDLIYRQYETLLNSILNKTESHKEYVLDFVRLLLANCSSDYPKLSSLKKEAIKTYSNEVNNRSDYFVNNAATKIQALFRGYSTRANLERNPIPSLLPEGLALSRNPSALFVSASSKSDASADLESVSSDSDALGFHN